jgi:hypothetical protein
MAINFAADMESCLIAKHQAAVQWFRHIHFCWQGSQKIFCLGQMSGSHF